MTPWDYLFINAKFKNHFLLGGYGPPYQSNAPTVPAALSPSGGGRPAGGEGAGPVVMVKHFPRGLPGAGGQLNSFSLTAADLQEPLTVSSTGKMWPHCFLSLYLDIVQAFARFKSPCMS